MFHSLCFTFLTPIRPPRTERAKKPPPRVEPRRGSPESGKGSVVPGDQLVATQDTQVDCVHLTPLMYDSPPPWANGEAHFPLHAPKIATHRPRLQNRTSPPNLSPV